MCVHARAIKVQVRGNNSAGVPPPLALRHAEPLLLRTPTPQLVVAAGASLVFLPDWQALIPECVAALQEREDALAGMQLLAGELREKQAAAATLAAALGPAAPGDKRLAALNSAVAAQQVRFFFLGGGGRTPASHQCFVASFADRLPLPPPAATPTHTHATAQAAGG
jgi:hypothetical protein